MRKQLIAAVIAFGVGSSLVSLDAQGMFWALVNGRLQTTNPVAFANGSAVAPSVTFASETTKGFYSNAVGQIAVSVSGTARHTFSAGGINNIQDTGVFTIGSAADLQISRPLAGTATFAGASGTNGIRFQFNGAPTVGTCGTSPSVTSTSRDTAGEVNVGTGGTATACGITFASTWSNAPFCVANVNTATTTNTRAMGVTTTTTTATFTAASAFAASDKIWWICMGSK